MRQVEVDVTKIDQVMQMMAQIPQEAHAQMAAEHLLAARNCLVGAMLDEYEFDLELARMEVGRISEREVREQALGALGAIAK